MTSHHKTDFPAGVAFSAGGSKMFVVGNDGADVNEYTLSNPFDVSTADFVDSFDVSSQDTTVQQAWRFSADGAKMFVTGYEDDRKRIHPIHSL